jgi:hypothetical protein
MRLRETASMCVEALFKLGADIPSFRGLQPDDIVRRLPYEPIGANGEWQRDAEFINREWAKVHPFSGSFPSLQGELMRLMNQLTIAPSAAFRPFPGQGAGARPEVWEANPPADPSAEGTPSEGIGTARDQGGAGHGGGAGAPRAQSATGQDEDLSPLQCDILEALRSLKATDPEKRRTGPEIASKVGGGATAQSVKAPLADLKRRGLVDSNTGRKGGSWLTSKGLAYINSLRPKQ